MASSIQFPSALKAIEDGRPPEQVNFPWFLRETRKLSGDVIVGKAGFVTLVKGWVEAIESSFPILKRSLPKVNCPRGYRQWKEMQAGIVRYCDKDEHLVLDLIPMPEGATINFTEGFSGEVIAIPDYGSKTLSSLNFKGFVKSLKKREHYQQLCKIWRAIVCNEYAYESDEAKAMALKQAEGDEVYNFCLEHGVYTEPDDAQYDVGSSLNEMIILPTAIPGREVHYFEYNQACHILNSSNPPSRELIMKYFQEVKYNELKGSRGPEPSWRQVIQATQRRLPLSLSDYHDAVNQSHSLRTSVMAISSVGTAPKADALPIEQQYHLLISILDHGIRLPFTRLVLDEQSDIFEDFVKLFIRLNKDNVHLSLKLIIRGWRSLFHMKDIEKKDELEAKLDEAKAQQLLDKYQHPTSYGVIRHDTELLKEHQDPATRNAIGVSRDSAIEMTRPQSTIENTSGHCGDAAKHSQSGGFIEGLLAESADIADQKSIQSQRDNSLVLDTRELTSNDSGSSPTLPRPTTATSLSKDASKGDQEASIIVQDAEQNTRAKSAASIGSSECPSATNELEHDSRGIGNIADETGVETLSKRKRDEDVSPSDSESTVVQAFKVIRRAPPHEKHQTTKGAPSKANSKLADKSAVPSDIDESMRYHNTRATSKLMIKPEVSTQARSPTQPKKPVHKQETLEAGMKTGWVSDREMRDYYSKQIAVLRNKIQIGHAVLKEQGIVGERFEKENLAMAELLALNSHLMSAYKALSIKITREIVLNADFDKVKARDRYRSMRKRSDPSWDPAEEDDFADAFFDASDIERHPPATAEGKSITDESDKTYEAACSEKIGGLGTDREARIPPLTDEHKRQDLLLAIKQYPEVTADNRELREKVSSLEERIAELEAENAIAAQGIQGPTQDSSTTGRLRRRAKKQ